MSYIASCRLDKGLVSLIFFNVSVSQVPMLPLTTEGNILVDGILTSCYASSHHDLGHLALAPMRYFPKLMDLIFGQSNDYPGYVKILENFGKMFSP